MLAFIVGLIIMGLVLGALARLLVPGPDPMGIGATIALGIVGALIGGLLGRLIFGRPAGFLLALLATIGLLLLVRGPRSHARI